MKEGWTNDDDYRILFTEEEYEEFGKRYQVATSLPGYRLVGLRGWDDFIIINTDEELFTVPTVPMDSKLLERYKLPSALTVESDDRIQGKIK